MRNLGIFLKIQKNGSVPIRRKKTEDIAGYFTGGKESSDSRKDWFAVGGYKKMANELGGMDTAFLEEFVDKMKVLLAEYNEKGYLTDAF